VQAILRERGMKRRTRTTITSPAKFLRELEAVRRLGYSEDREENNYGVRCVAAPIFNATGEVEAAINVTGTTQQITGDSLPRVAEAVKEAARRISSNLGFRALRQAAH
jgi:IclR family transcriptional regulator, KDG regulon repressor